MGGKKRFNLLKFIELITLLSFIILISSPTAAQAATKEVELSPQYGGVLKLIWNFGPAGQKALKEEQNTE
jgi:hypothetical protein